MSETPPPARPFLALGLRLASVAMLGTMAALIKLASERDIHLLETIFWRQGLTRPMAIAWVMATSGLSTLATRRPWAHATRGAAGATGMVLNFLSIILLPLAEATTLGFTAPIFAVFLSVMLLGEKVGPYRWMAVALGFAGVVIIAQPGDGHLPLMGAMAAMGGAMMVAVISIQIRDMNRTEKPLAIVFWFAAFTTPIAGLFLPFVMTSHSAADWALLMVIGVVGGLGQLLLTAALRFGAVASVVVMDYSALFWATLYGWMFWDMLPTAATWLGAPLIIAAGLIIAWREHRLSLSRPVQGTAG